MKKKIQKNKAYELIGRIVVYGSLYIGSIIFMCWAFLQNTIY
jgi:hypothetical protein